LFATTAIKEIQAKVAGTTNKDPTFEADAGFLRRLLAEILCNKFVSVEDFVEALKAMLSPSPEALKKKALSPSTHSKGEGK